jgi:SAM-dependent methyltransferase
MSYSPEAARVNNAAKIRWEAVPYFHGKVLDIGCGSYKCFPHWVGMDDADLPPHLRPDINDSNLSRFADKSHDAVFSSFYLQRLEKEKVAETLKEWLRVVKDDGYLMLYLPDEEAAVKHPLDSWLANKEFVVSQVKGASLVDYQVRHEGDEYGLWFVFRKGEHKPIPKPEKTCAVIRYGAIGDMIQMSSILPWLKS